MALTTINSSAVVKQWNDRALAESISRNKFMEYIKTSVDAPFRLDKTLSGKPGDQVTFTFVGQLSGDPVLGDDPLHGNAEALPNFAKSITIERYSKAIEIGEHEARKPIKSLLDERGPMLLDWDSELMRDQIIAALGSLDVNGATPFASCTTAQKNAWVTAQYAQDRVLFGAAESNYSAGDFATSLATVDAAGDVLTPAIVSLLKRIVRRKKAGKYRLAPLSEAGNEGYVLFCPSPAFRDFRNASATQSALHYAEVRGGENPWFTGEDLMCDGVRIVEVPEIETIDGGAASAKVAPCYLIGKSAVGIAMAEQPNVREEDFDFKRQMGMAIMRTSGIDKLMFDNTQIGVATLFVAGVADT